MGKNNKKRDHAERLAKLIKDEPEPLLLPMVTSPLIFTFIETICKGYLQMAKLDPPSRDLMARFAFAFRAEAFARFGHDTAETFMLGKMLRQASLSNAELKAGRQDALTYINSQKSKAARLSGEQSTAAEHVIKIWEAFGRFLNISGSQAFSGGAGGDGGRSLQPLDVMGDDLKKHHREIFGPWLCEAQKIRIARLRNNGNITLAAIIFKVLIEDYYPEQLDGAYGMIKGSTLNALKVGLTFYWSPEKIAPAFAQGPRQAISKASSGARALAGASEPEAA